MTCLITLLSEFNSMISGRLVKEASTKRHPRKPQDIFEIKGIAGVTVKTEAMLNPILNL